MSALSLPTRKIGNTDVTSIGWGAMGIAAFYGNPEPDEVRLKFLDDLYESGCRNWDTADCYGDSEELIGKWFKKTGKRDDIFLATKVGFVFGERMVNGEPEYIRSAIDKSLERLGVSCIDLLYLHRADLETPIEKSIQAMAEYVKAGKVKYLGISEVSEKGLRRAHAVHPISAYQVEYSPFTLDIEDPKIGILKATKELGIALVAYSPLGRGLLTGRFKGPEDFPEGDSRPFTPRFSKENFPNVLKLVDDLEVIGKKHGASSAQVTLAWLLAQSDNVIPIPGTRSIKRLEENLGAFRVQLSDEELKTVRDAAERSNIGDVARYSVEYNQHTLIDSPSLDS